MAKTLDATTIHAALDVLMESEGWQGVLAMTRKPSTLIDGDASTLDAARDLCLVLARDLTELSVVLNGACRRANRAAK